MVPFASPLDEAERRRHRLRNILHTWLLILGSGALVALIAWILFGTVGLVWAAVLTGIGLWSAGQVSPKMVLGLYRARPLNPANFPSCTPSCASSRCAPSCRPCPNCTTCRAA
jgi:hypothetical protein